ncbi:MAG: hypothetical protein AAFX94_16650 [Myxococcota bacterium]
MPEGPREFFRRCRACDTPWGIGWGDGALEAVELPDLVADLLVPAPDASSMMDAAMDPQENPVLRRCVAVLAEARFERGGNPADDMPAAIHWLASAAEDSAKLTRGLDFLGIALRRGIGHQEVERAQTEAMKNAFAARIDEGRGFEEAAELARRDSTRGRTLMSLPTLRNLDVVPLLELLAGFPSAEPDYGSEQLALRLRRVLQTIATSARRPPKLTVTAESRARLDELFPERE